MNAVELRVAKPKEAAELAAFMRRCYLAAYGDVANDDDTAAHLAHAYNDALVASALANPTHCLLRTWSGSTPTGYAWLAQAPAPAPIHAESAVELRRFYLSPEAIGSGAADVLMQSVLAKAQEWATRGVFLTTWKQSERAIRFYGRQGFRALGTVQFRIGATAFDDWLMWRSV